MVLVDKFPQLLAGLLESEDRRKDVPHDEIHADNHVDNVEENAVAQVFDFFDAAFEVPDNLVDWFHYFVDHFVEEAFHRIGLICHYYIRVYNSINKNYNSLYYTMIYIT